MLLYVYRLRQSGIRTARLALRHEGMRGEFAFEPNPYEVYGNRPMMARLLEPGTTKELIPHMEDARIVRVRRAILVAGTEVISRASKSKGERYRQTWVCSVESIPFEEWPAPPRTGSGFDAADDDDGV